MRRLPLLLLAVTVGCHLPGEPKESDRPKRPDEITDFATLYGSNCAGCHGADGRFGPAPPLNDPLFLSIVPGQEVEHLLREGREGTLMPPFVLDNGGGLTKEQVKIVADGLFSTWKPKDPPANVPPYRDDQPGDEAVGAKLFTAACAGCHGDKGQGLTAGAINDAAFLDLISDDALRRLVITGRPDLKMPAFDGKAGRPDDFKPLTSKEINDLVALLASWRRGGP